MSTEHETATAFILPIAAALDDLKGPNHDRQDYLTQQAAALYQLLGRREFPSNEDGAWIRDAVKDATRKLDLYALELRIRSLDTMTLEQKEKLAERRVIAFDALRNAADLLYSWRRTKMAQMGWIKEAVPAPTETRFGVELGAVFAEEARK